MCAISGAWRRSPLRSVGWNHPRVALRTDLRHEITLAQGCHGPLQGSQVDMDPSAGQFLRWGPRSHRSPAAAAPARRRRVSGRRGRGRGRGRCPPAGAPRTAPRPIPGAVEAAASPGRSGGWRGAVALIAVHVADGPADIHGQGAEGRLEHEAGDGQLAGLLTIGDLERDVSGGPAGPGDPIRCSHLSRIPLVVRRDQIRPSMVIMYPVTTPSKASIGLPRMRRVEGRIMPRS